MAQENEKCRSIRYAAVAGRVEVTIETWWPYNDVTTNYSEYTPDEAISHAYHLLGTALEAKRQEKA